MSDSEYCPARSANLCPFEIPELCPLHEPGICPGRFIGAPLPGKWKDDWELIFYCELHSNSERALFHKEDIDRMLTLAGMPDKESAREWASMHGSMKELCRLARERLSRAAEAARAEEKRQAEAKERALQDERSLAAIDVLFGDEG